MLPYMISLKYVKLTYMIVWRIEIGICSHLVDEIDRRLVGCFGFTSRAEVVKEGVRRLLTELAKNE